MSLMEPDRGDRTAFTAFASVPSATLLLLAQYERA